MSIDQLFSKLWEMLLSKQFRPNAIISELINNVQLDEEDKARLGEIDWLFDK